MADLDPFADDPRVMELETLQAIYPEIAMHPADRFSFTLELPITPEQPVTVAFPAAADREAAAPAPADAPAGPPAAPNTTHVLTHLPPVRIAVSLPAGYPADKPPRVALSTTPAWLPDTVLPALQRACVTLWDDAGRGEVVYDYIVHVQEAAEAVFGLATGPEPLAVDPCHRLALLDCDAKARRAAFEHEAFDCGVCLDRKTGAQCHRMQDCGHVFCIQCLQDFYTDAITNGALATVRCLEPNCAKSREEARAAAAADAAGPAQGGQPQQIRISPGELLQIPLDEPTVKRYVDLSYKTALEADKNVVYCPRAWCDGVARPSSPSSTPAAAAAAGGGADPAPDLLSICQSCALAFCRRCYQTWHGYLFHCRPRKTNGELTEEDKATLEYMQRNTTPCCTCDAPAQKTDGCNHMVCARCNTHFCYLCAAWLNPANPYAHFSQAADGTRTNCYGRLWESRDENSGYVYDAFLDGADDEDGDDEDGDDEEDPLGLGHGDFNGNGDDFDHFDLGEEDGRYLQFRVDNAPDDEQAQLWQGRLDAFVRDRRRRAEALFLRLDMEMFRRQAARHEQRMRRRQERAQQQEAHARRRREEALAHAAAAAVPQTVNVAVEAPLVLRIAIAPAPAAAAAVPAAPVQNDNDAANGGRGGGRGGRGRGRGRGGRGRGM